MTELERTIEQARDAYYNGKPIISDEEFDALLDLLEKENPESELIDSIGEDSSSNFEKAPHIINMNSQAKVNTEADFIDWWVRRIDKGDAVVQEKLDGISIELQYEKGNLVRAVTRGNGAIGDDITANVLKMKGVPQRLPETDKDIAVRGEIVLYKDIFEKKYKEQGYKNPRNMASGLSKQKEGVGCEDLNVLVYDAECYNTERNFITEYTKKLFLTNNGFDVVPTIDVSSPKEVIEIRDRYKKNRDSLNYDIDGLVIKINKIDYKDKERNRPNKQVAFKFETELAITTLKSVEWQVSGITLTPVGILEPIEIAGATISKASLANPNRVKELDLHIGDKVVITRRGEIIPRIEEVYSHDGIERVSPPFHFDYQGTSYKTKNEGTRLIINDNSFPLIRYHRIAKWVKVLDVKGFGPALLNDLFGNWVNDIIDLYEINLDDYLETTNLKKATRKAFDNLYAIKEVSLADFIGGFDIEGVGRRVIEMIGATTFEEIRDMKISDLEKVEGIGEDRAYRIYYGLVEHCKQMEKILDKGYIKIKKVEEEEEVASNLNKSFCFTGALETMTRNEAFALVEKAGGIVKKNIAMGLDYLVTNTPNSGSSKNQKADKYGVKKITEIEFLKILASK